MEKHLRDVAAWVWRYLENERHYPGLHFTASREGCAVITETVARLVAAGGGRRSIALRRLEPGDEAKITGGRRYVSFAKLTSS